VKFLLDTNTCVAHLTGRSVHVGERIRSSGFAEIALCSVVKSELLFGAYGSARVAENLASFETFFRHFRSLAFDDPAAALAGKLRADLKKAGTPIGPNDLLIAAIALAHELTLVTANTSEFARVPGLQLENWIVPT
jgi:tRNA(fMet)-specific endonuclease VapC